MFSIIIPIRNAERYLKECLDSCVSQDYQHFEIIVVDNASTDGGPDMVETYRQKYPFIQYIRHDSDRGLLQSRITGAKAASGEYIINVDADDYFVTPEALSIIAKAAKKTGADIIQYGIKAAGDWWSNWFRPLSLEPIWGEEIARAYFFANEGIRCSSLWSRALRRSFYLEVIALIPENLNIVLTEDLLQSALMMERAKVYVGLPNALYFYRIHSEGYQQGWTISKMVENFRTTKLIFDVLSENLQAEHFLIFKKLISVHMLQALCSLRSPSQPDAELHALGSSYLSLFGEECFIANMESFDLNQCLAALKCFNFTPSPPRPFRKKIGIVTPSLYVGGAERVYALLATAFFAAGWDPVLFTQEPPHPRDFSYPRSVKRFVLGTVTEGGCYERWQEYLKDNPVDAFIVDDHDSFFHFTLIHVLCLKLLGQKIIMQPHSDYFGFTRIEDTAGQCVQALVHRFFYPFAEAVCLLVPYNVLYLQLMGIRRALFMPNPLTIEPSKVSIGNRENMILWVGQFSAEKNPLAALEAFRKALPRLPKGAKLCMLGDGYQKPDILRYIQEHGLQSAVLLPGFIDPESYYRRAKILLMTSTTEAYLLVEAKACGLPAAMFALPYVCSAQVGGCIQVPQNDTDALARETARLFEDSDARDKLARQALASLDGLKTEDVIRRWDTLIRAVCEGDVEAVSKPPELGAFGPAVREMASHLTDVLQLSWNRALQSLPSLSRNEQRWLKIFHIFKKAVHGVLPPHSLRRKLAKKIYTILKKIYKTIRGK